MFINPVTGLTELPLPRSAGDKRFTIRNMAEDYRVLYPVSTRVMITQDIVINNGDG